MSSLGRTVRAWRGRGWGNIHLSETLERYLYMSPTGPLDFLGDPCNNSRQVAIHLVVPETQNREAPVADPLVAPAIVFHSVLAAIDLNKQQPQ